MIDHARLTAQNHSFTYDERIKVESVTQAVCDLALRFGESMDNEDAMMSRPFGVALLIAGIDEIGPQLYHTDPSGTFVRYEAKAIGSGSEAAQAELQDKFHQQMTLVEAQNLTLKILKQVMEEKLDHHNVQIAQVSCLYSMFRDNLLIGLIYRSLPTRALRSFLTHNCKRSSKHWPLKLHELQFVFYAFKQ
ncbi:proteasome component pup2 [Ceratobasidium sp. 428]|nr:proteasome component pup2 [Ceratobasidium sp. 428]